MPLQGKACVVISYTKRRRKGCKRKITDQEEISPAVKVPKQVCYFCLSSEVNELEYGELITQGDITVHYFCLLLSSGLSQNGKLSDKKTIKGFLQKDIIREHKRGSRLRCYLCHEKGATIGCCLRSCKKVFHLPCGRKNRTFHLFFGEFSSFCEQHWPLHCDPAVDDPSCCSTEKSTCAICLSAVDARPSFDSLSSPCCKKSWFHRLCIQRYAMSAGKHFFKCPLCNCLKDFQQEMLDSGIYIPNQDASWERQPNAFSELLERHSTCDAPECKCPQGRNHDAMIGSFDLILCHTCGSFGSHKACHGLVQVGISYLCPICSEIAKSGAIQATSKLHVMDNNSIGSSSMHLNCEGHDTHSQTSRSSFPTSASMNVVQVIKEEGFVKVDVENTSDNEDVPLNLYKEKNELYKDTFVRDNLFKFATLPSVVVVRIDSLFSIPFGTVNLKRLTKWSYDQKAGCLVRRRSYIKGRMNSKKLKEVKPIKSHDQQDSGCVKKRPYVKREMYSKKHKSGEKQAKSHDQQGAGCFEKRPYVKSGLYCKKRKMEVKPAKSHDHQDAECSEKRPYVKSGMHRKKRKHKNEGKSAKSYRKRSYVENGLYSEISICERKAKEKGATMMNNGTGIFTQKVTKESRQMADQEKGTGDRSSLTQLTLDMIWKTVSTKSSIRPCREETNPRCNGVVMKKEDLVGKKKEVLDKKSEVVEERDVIRNVRLKRKNITAAQRSISKKKSIALKGRIAKTNIVGRRKHEFFLPSSSLKMSSASQGVEKEQFIARRIPRMEIEGLNGAKPSNKNLLHVQHVPALNIERGKTARKKVLWRCLKSSETILEILPGSELNYMDQEKSNTGSIYSQHISLSGSDLDTNYETKVKNISSSVEKKGVDTGTKICFGKDVSSLQCGISNHLFDSDFNYVTKVGNISSSMEKKNVDIDSELASKKDVSNLSFGISNPPSDLNINCDTNMEKISSSIQKTRINSDTEVDFKKDKSDLPFGLSNTSSDLDINCETKIENIQFCISNPPLDSDFICVTKVGNISSSIEKKKVDIDTDTEMEIKKDVSNLPFGLSNPLSDLDINCETNMERISNSIEKKSDDIDTETDSKKDKSNLPLGISNTHSNLDIHCETNMENISGLIEKKSVDTDTEMDSKNDKSNLPLGISNTHSNLDINCETNMERTLNSIEKKSEDIDTETDSKKDKSSLPLGISNTHSNLDIHCETNMENISSLIEKKSVDTDTEMDSKKDKSNLPLGISNTHSNLDINCETTMENISSLIEKKSVDTDTEMDSKKDKSNLPLGISNTHSNLDIHCETNMENISSLIEKKSVDTDTEMDSKKDGSNLPFVISKPISLLDINCETNVVNTSSSIEKKSVDTDTEVEFEIHKSNLPSGTSNPVFNSDINCETNVDNILSSISSLKLEKKSVDTDIEIEFKRDVSNLWFGISNPPSDLNINCEMKVENVSSSIEKKRDDNETEVVFKKDKTNLHHGISNPLSDLDTNCEPQAVQISTLI